MKSSSSLVAVAPVIACALAACGPGFAELKPDQMASLELRHLEPHLCGRRGVSAQLQVTVTTSDGKKVATAVGDDTKDRLDPKLFTFVTTAGSVNQALALLHLPLNPILLLEPIEVTATLTARPELTTRWTVPVFFDCGAVVDGRPDQAEGGAEAPVENGYVVNAPPGENGHNGGPGQRGSNGPQATVLIGWLDTEAHGRLALVSVKFEYATEFFLLDPAGRPLELNVSGGQGGHGGSGQSGFNGGNGGDGGDGGDGGSVTIYYDRASPDLARLVHVINEAGPPGQPGPGGYGGISEDGNSSGNDGASGGEGRWGRPGPAPVLRPVASPTDEMVAKLRASATSPAQAKTPPAQPPAQPDDARPPTTPPTGDAATGVVYDATMTTTVTQRKPRKTPPAAREAHGSVTIDRVDDRRVKLTLDGTCWFEAERGKGKDSKARVTHAECRSGAAVMSDVKGTIDAREATLEVDLHGRFEVPGQASGDIAVRIHGKRP